ncbi:MAG: hypothetical protein AAFX99_28010 [Myxococcota bacterium]
MTVQPPALPGVLDVPDDALSGAGSPVHVEAGLAREDGLEVDALEVNALGHGLEADALGHGLALEDGPYGAGLPVCAETCEDGLALEDVPDS